MSYPNPLSELLREPNLLVPRKKPTGHVAIDWRHPLAEGLAAVYLFNDLRCTNLVNGAPAVSRTGSNELHGNEMYFGTRLQNYSFDLGPEGTSFQLAGKYLGVVAGFRCPNIVSATDENAPISCWSSTGTPGFLLRYRAQEERWEWYFEATGGSDAVISSNGSATKASMAEFSVVGATHNESGTTSLFLPDGVTTVSDATSSSGPLASYTENVLIGDTPHNTTDYWVDYLHFIYIWSRGITIDEVNDIRRDPYQIVVPA